MKNKLKKRICLKLLVGFALLGTFFYAFYAIPYFNKNLAWRDIETDNFILGDRGTEYKISKGYLIKSGKSRKIKFELNPLNLIENERALRFALFYQINKEDPLFLGPGVDPEGLADSVKRLEAVQGQLLSKLSSDKNFVPIKFLNSIVDLEKKHSIFQREGNLENGNHLLKALYKSNNNYLADAKELSAEIKRREKNVNRYSAFASITTTDIILDDLGKIKNNSEKLGQEINRRRNCLNFSVTFCERSLVTESIKVDLTTKTEQSANLLDKNNLYYPKDPVGLALAGPYRVSSVCWSSNGEKVEHYLYEIIPSKEGSKCFMPKLATTNYYKEIQVGREEVIDGPYKKKGINWRPVLEASTYACNDLTYMPSLAALHTFTSTYTEILKEAPSSLENLPKEFQETYKKGSELERDLLAAKYPDEESLEKLGEYYKNIYFMLVRWELEGNRLPEDLVKQKDIILERSLIIERRFSGLDGVINYFSWLLEEYNRVYERTSKSEGLKNYIYAIRNGYSLTYLGFSKSVWRSDEPLTLIEKGRSQIRSDLRSVEEMLILIGQEKLSEITQTRRDQMLGLVEIDIDKQ